MLLLTSLESEEATVLEAMLFKQCGRHGNNVIHMYTKDLITVCCFVFQLRVLNLKKNKEEEEEEEEEAAAAEEEEEEEEMNKTPYHNPIHL